MSVSIHTLLAIGLLATAKPSAFADDPPKQPPAAAVSNDAADLATAARHRQLWEQFRYLGPAERGDICVTPCVQELTELYELDATQTNLVRAEIETIASERRASMGSLGIEYNNLSNSAAEIWWNYRQAAIQDEESPRPSFKDDAAYQQSLARMSEIEAQFPIDWDGALTRVETLLPPNQASRGRVRVHISRIERAARQAQIVARRGATASMQEAIEAADAVTVANEAMRHVIVQEALNHAAREVDANRMPPEIKKEIRSVIRNAQKKISDDQNAASTTNNPIARQFDRWEAHTRDFIMKYKLNASQQAAAISMMTELRDRAENLNRSIMIKTSKDARSVTLKDRQAIDARIERLFDQLNRRLESILTVEQRRSVPQVPTAEARSTPKR